MHTRIIDIIISALAITISLPIMILIGVLIKTTSDGPVLFRQIRVGKKGKRFRIYKLRTMAIHEQFNGIPTYRAIVTPADDPEITKIGKFLRRHKIDELPQFINVLQGDMSVCGPRPDLPEYVADYTNEQMEILSVKPGITDLASVTINIGRMVNGVENPEEFYAKNIMPEKLRLRLEYVRNRSLLLDLKIMLMTLKTPFLPLFYKPAKDSDKRKHTNGNT